MSMANPFKPSEFETMVKLQIENVLRDLIEEWDKTDSVNIKEYTNKIYKTMYYE